MKYLYRVHNYIITIKYKLYISKEIYVYFKEIRKQLENRVKTYFCNPRPKSVEISIKNPVTKKYKFVIEHPRCNRCQGYIRRAAGSYNYR